MIIWLLILLTVGLGSTGDVCCAKGMAQHGEISKFGPSGVGHILRAIVTQRWVILGITCDALSFFALLALLSMSQLSIAVPATALSFVVDTLGAKFFLHEQVHWKRWVGVMLVTAGVLLTVQSGSEKRLTGTRTTAPTSVHSNKHQPGNH